MKRKQRWITLILSLLLATLMLPANLTFAEDRSTQIDFTVDEIQQAGIEDRNFAQAIYDSIKAQPDKFLDGNTLYSNTYTTMEELLNSYTGNLNASNRSIHKINGISMLKSCGKWDLFDNYIEDFTPMAIVKVGDTFNTMPEEQKLYYGKYATPIKVEIGNNPVKKYSYWVGGRIRLYSHGTDIPENIISLDKYILFVNSGNNDFSINYNIPLDLYCDNERASASPGSVEILPGAIVGVEGADTGAGLAQGAQTVGKIPYIPVSNIKNTGVFVATIGTDDTCQWGTVVTNQFDQPRAQQQTLSWYYTVQAKVYSKIEKGSTDTSHSVSLVKLGADDQDVKPGAQYSLYIKKDSGSELIAEKLTTDKNGLLTVDSLEAGEYYFVETKAPQGYELDATPIEFAIENGSIEILGGSGNKMTPTDGEEQTIDGTFVLSGSDEAPASVKINEPQNGTFDTLTLEWTDGNQGGAAGKVVYQAGTKNSTDELIYVANKEEAEQKALDKLKECRDLYQNVKISASFAQKIELSQVDELAVTVDKTVTKVWDDHDNQDGIRPTEVKIQLYADDKAVGNAVALNAGNDWSYTWTGLARIADNKEIVYSVKEVDVPDGYTENVEIDKDGNFKVTNTRKAEQEKPAAPGKPGGGGGLPRTGDFNNIVEFTALLGISILGFVIILKKRTGVKNNL